MAKMATREAYGKALAELAKENKKILVLDADLSGSTKTGEVKKVAPEQHFNFGIAEGNMMAAAAGMATSGNIVFASTFAMFAAGRAFEQVRNSICYPHLNVKVCATHAGLTVGEDGASHQSVEDVALMRSIPGMVVISPADGVETKAAIRAVAAYDGPCYVRLGRMAVEDVYTEDTLNFQIGKGNVIRKGTGVALIATGIMVEAAMKAADALKDKGMDVTVVDMHTIKPIDEELIVDQRLNLQIIVKIHQPLDLFRALFLKNSPVNLSSLTSRTDNQAFPVGSHYGFGHSRPFIKIV